MFVASGAYLSAVFLIGDARRAGDEELESYFARRALDAASVAGVAAGLAWSSCTPKLATSSTALPTRACHWCSFAVLCPAFSPLSRRFSLEEDRRPGLRPLAGGAVIAVIWGWGVAQFPYLLPTSLKITEAAAPPDTLAAVIIVFIVAAILVLPALGLLYWLSQKELLGE